MKRKAHVLYTGDRALQLAKRRKLDEELSVEVYENEGKKKADELVFGPKRTSRLRTPIIQLKGHAGEVFAARFSPCGTRFASSGADQKLLLWQTYADDPSTACIHAFPTKPFRNACLDLCWCTSHRIYTASADRTLMSWSVERGCDTRRFSGHTREVNCVRVAGGDGVGAQMEGREDVFVSCSNDATIRVWDARIRRATVCIARNRLPTLSLAVADSRIYSGNLSNDISVWDLRKARDRSTEDETNVNELSVPVELLTGHGNGVTGLALSHDGCYLASNSTDCSVILWDLRSFAQRADSQIRNRFEGSVRHGVSRNLLRVAWATNDRWVASGSDDCRVFVWEADCEDGTPLYNLPGHEGCVNDVDFHPKEPILLSASSDTTLYMGELDL